MNLTTREDRAFGKRDLLQRIKCVMTTFSGRGDVDFLSRGQAVEMIADFNVTDSPQSANFS
jgi:hypothetical protein